MAAPRALESDLSPKKLSDLQISSGLQVQVELVKSRQRTRLEWIGLYQNEYLLLRAPAQESFARSGDRMRIRLISGNWICAFDTQLLEQNNQPEPVWWCSYPPEIELARLREHTRLPLVLRVRIDGADPLKGPEGVSALITDIHPKGAALQTSTSVGQTGDSLFVSTLIAYADTEQLLLLPAKIMSQRREELGGRVSHLYGIEFESLDEETRVYLNGFIAERYLASQGIQF